MAKAKAAANVFTTAAKVETGVIVGKGKKDDKVRHEVAGLKQFVYLNAAVEALSTMRDTLKGEVKDAAKAIFVRVGKAQKAQPDNFKGIDDNVSASCELRKRSTRSPLSADEIELFDKYGVPYGEEVDTEARFIINPEYMNNQELLQKVSDAIQSVKGIPENFIQMQPKKFKNVVTEESVKTVFAKPELLDQFVDLVTVDAIKPVDVPLTKKEILVAVTKAFEAFEG